MRGIPDQQAGGGGHTIGAPAAGGQGVQSAEIPGTCHAHGHLVSGAQGRNHVPTIGALSRGYRQHRRNDGGAGVAAGLPVSVVQVKGAGGGAVGHGGPLGATFVAGEPQRRRSRGVEAPHGIAGSPGGGGEVSRRGAADQVDQDVCGGPGNGGVRRAGGRVADVFGQNAGGPLGHGTGLPSMGGSAAATTAAVSESSSPSASRSARARATAARQGSRATLR